MIPKTDGFQPVGRDAQRREFAALLRLASIKGLGPHRISRLVQRFGTATNVLAARERALLESGLLSDAGVQAVLACGKQALPGNVLDRFDRRAPDESLLLISHPAYPDRLRSTAQPPLWLWCRGGIPPWNAPHVALVGSRDATRWGVDLTSAWSFQLAAAGAVVVSGLAEGIDAAAHQGALDAGGMTIAVMGTGIDRVYPRKNATLAKAVGHSGVLMSEFHPGVGARAHHFPQRNRIIAGLCHATIVMEAAEGSGSLITARMAQDEGREVGIVPGRPGDRNAKGSNRALKGHIGGVVGGIDDIIAILEQIPGLKWRSPSHGSGGEAADGATAPSPGDPHKSRRASIRKGTPAGAIRAALAAHPMSVVDLMDATEMSRSCLEDLLLDLLLDGRVTLELDQRYRWRK